MKPRVSLLMPSRERYELAKASIESLGEGRFEVLVRVDDDDPQLKEYKTLPAKVVIGPRYGYEGLAKYYNELAAKAKGDWIMLWNDDATMETNDWLFRITNFNHTKPIVLNPWNPEDNLFPVISRKWYDIIGHFSLSTHADSWVQAVGSASGTQVYVEFIGIKHLGEELSDPTHTRVRDVVRETSEHHRSEAMERERQKEAEQIYQFLEKEGYVNENNN